MDLLYLIEILPDNIIPPEKSFMFTKLSHKINNFISDNNIKLPIYIKLSRDWYKNKNIENNENNNKINRIISNNYILNKLEKLIINYNIINLELPNCNFKENNIERLSKIIKLCPFLIYLNLRNNRLDYNKVKILFVGLKDLVLLKYIDLSYNFIKIFQKIPKLFLLQNNFNLEIIDLSNNRSGPSGALLLSKILYNLPNLKVLDISYNSIKSIGAITLAETLGKLTSLTKLDLTDNFIESSGIKSITDALLNCSLLSCLKLKNNWLKNEDISYLLKKVPYLEDLDISYNNLDNQNNIISNELPNCLSLINLNIESNNIKQNEIKVFLKYLINVIY